MGSETGMVSGADLGLIKGGADHIIMLRQNFIIILSILIK